MRAEYVDGARTSTITCLVVSPALVWSYASVGEQLALSLPMCVYVLVKCGLNATRKQPPKKNACHGFHACKVVDGGVVGSDAVPAWSWAKMALMPSSRLSVAGFSIGCLAVSGFGLEGPISMPQPTY